MPSKPISPTLQGCRIALTLAADEPISPAPQLADLEAEVFHYPVAQVLPPDSYDELDAALRRCHRGEIDWLFLTTPCAVEAVAERLRALQIKPSTVTDLKVAFFGAKTRLTASALLPTWHSKLPDHAHHEQLVESTQLTPEDSVVIPLALHTRADWASLVRATGAEAIAVPAYRLLLGRGGDDLPGLLWGGLVDAIVFFTENSVRHFVIRLKVEGGSLDMLRDVVVAALDAPTAAAARAYELPVQVLPAQPTLAALTDSLLAHFSTLPQSA